MSAASQMANYEVRSGIAVVTMNNPPVNSLGLALRRALMDCLARAAEDSEVRAIVLCGSGKLFCGGADIAEFDNGGEAELHLNEVNAAIEQSRKPVVAAIHGMALGGGLELAMSCHARVAAKGTRLGLPEVTLGILPGAGGTQRLPRLVEVVRALPAMMSGEAFKSSDASQLGLIDAEADGDVVDVAIDWIKRALDEGRALKPTSQRPVRATGVAADFWESQRATAAKSMRGAPAPLEIIEVVRAAVDGVSLQVGLRLETEAFERLKRSPQSAGLRHLFFAQREANKIPGLPKDISLRPVTRVGIVGAGTMGGGIAMNFVNAGIPVRLVETNQAQLDRGLGIIEKNYQATAAKGRMTAEQVKERMGRITGALDYAALADCDLVIEAVFEDLALKKKVCAELGKVCKPGAIIASNTSTLDVDALAEASGRPADVCGMHFFSPANVMKLLEIVRGEKTVPDVLATVVALAKAIGKVAVVSGVCYGFIGNRMLEGYLRETDFLLMEGATPKQIDRALESYGMAMGPCRMMDMAGVDVNAMVLLQRGLAGGLPEDPSYRQVCLHLHESGQKGQKSGSGYYKYDGRTPVDDSETVALAERLAKQYGIARRTDIGDEEIVQRCLYPLINEGHLILEEGISYRPGDIDVVWTAGYGFPRLRGGPMHYADHIGKPLIVEAMRKYATATGDSHGYWKPAKSLAEAA